MAVALRTHDPQNCRYCTAISIPWHIGLGTMLLMRVLHLLQGHSIQGLVVPKIFARSLDSNQLFPRNIFVYTSCLTWERTAIVLVVLYVQYLERTIRINIITAKRISSDSVSVRLVG